MIYEKNFNSSAPNYEQQLRGLLLGLTEMAQRHTHSIPGGIFALDEEQQQAFITKLNPYARFEFDEYPDLHHLPVQTTGAGMLYVSDFEGNILGAEAIADTDSVSGYISDVCLFPTPTIDCLVAADEVTGIPQTNQILSPILVLDRGVFKTGRNEAQSYDQEIDLANFQVHLPLAHYLHFSVASS